jgi:hypothetical protein
VTAKPLATLRPPVARAWFSWWARHRLPALAARRLYWTDLDGAIWAAYTHRSDRVVLAALIEIMPWNGCVRCRRSSIAALRELGRRSGLPALVLEVDHRRRRFRVRSAQDLQVLLEADEKGLARWLEEVMVRW